MEQASQSDNFKRLALVVFPYVNNEVDHAARTNPRQIGREAARRALADTLQTLGAGNPKGGMSQNKR